MSVLQVADTPARVLRLGALSLDRDQNIVRFDGQAIPLARTDIAVLGHLLANRGVPMTKGSIVRAVFDTAGRDERLADVSIMRLRVALAEAGCPDVIRTMPGRGYMIADPDRPISPRCLAPRPAPDAQVAGA